MEKKNNRGTTGKVEDHFPRHVQGLGLEKKIAEGRRKHYSEGPQRQKNPKEARAGLGWQNRYEGWLVDVR